MGLSGGLNAGLDGPDIEGTLPAGASVGAPAGGGASAGGGTSAGSSQLFMWMRTLAGGAPGLQAWTEGGAAAGSGCCLAQVGAVVEEGRWGSQTPEASSSLPSAGPDLASGTKLCAAATLSTFRSSVRGVASLGVVAWLVSVSYVMGAEMEELHREEGQQESQEQLELQETHTNLKMQRCMWPRPHKPRLLTLHSITCCQS